jgi:cytochrome P450
MTSHTTTPVEGAGSSLGERQTSCPVHVGRSHGPIAADTHPPKRPPRDMDDGAAGHGPEYVYTSANKGVDHIPGDYGLPLVGNTLRAIVDYLGLVQGKHQRYGNVYRGRAFFERQVTLVGPAGAQLVLQDRTRNFSSFLGWYPNLGRLFPNSIILRDFDDHKRHRFRLLGSFRRPAMEAYLESMSRVIDADVESWHRLSDFRFYPMAKQLLLKVAMTVFLGVKVGDRLDAINVAISNMVDAVTAVSRLPIPGTTYWKGERGRRYLDGFIRDKIPEKRLSDDADMLAQLCLARDDSGEGLSDQEIVDDMIFLIMAAHDTVTSSATSLAHLLAAAQEWQERVRGDIGAVSASHPRFDDISNIASLDWAFREALRLYPPVPAIPRRCIEAFDFEGHTIPANTAIWIVPALNHRLAAWWSNPDSFDPARFSPQRGEDRRHPFAWIPFGGGAHTCIGLQLGGLITKTLMFHLLRRYSLMLPSGYSPNYRMLPIPKARDGLRLLLRPIGQPTRRETSSRDDDEAVTQVPASRSVLHRH